MTFSMQADYLKTYAAYCSNQNAAFETLQKLKERKDKQFETFLTVIFTSEEDDEEEGEE